MTEPSKPSLKLVLLLTGGLIIGVWALALLVSPPPKTRPPRAVAPTRATTASANEQPIVTAADKEAAAKFLVSKFDADLKRLEELVRKGEWYKARGELYQRRVELAPVLRSSRATVPEIVALKNRLDTHAKAIDAQHMQEIRAREEAAILRASALYAAFEENEIRANQTYKDKRVQIRGEIKQIGTDILSTPYVLFDRPDGIFSVQAMFDKRDEAALARLNVGQTITVTCRCDGKLGNVIMRDCAIN